MLRLNGAVVVAAVAVVELEPASEVALASVVVEYGVAVA